MSLGISWSICKSERRPGQITMPAPHHPVFIGWMPFLPPIQQHQNTEGLILTKKLSKNNARKVKPQKE